MKNSSFSRYSPLTSQSTRWSDEHAIDHRTPEPCLRKSSPQPTAVESLKKSTLLPDEPFFRPPAEKIGATRFELATSRSRTVRSIQAELRPAIACFDRS